MDSQSRSQISRTDDGTDATVQAVCRRVLDSATLHGKLTIFQEKPLDHPGAPELRDAPAREAGLELGRPAPPLPRPSALSSPEARARCLARFAHHELMAAELFAWALLRWPGLPRALRAGLFAVLGDEQRHCRMYLVRLAAHGSELREHPCSGYFWRHAAAIARSPRGPAAFLAAMGLTLEQANLDFAPLYAEGFRAAGDEASARVCEAVHEDEIRHVRLAAVWLPRLARDGSDTAPPSDLESYRRHVPFPLGAARAKGRRFDADSRRRAGLSEALIEHVRSARSTQERRRGGRP